MRVKLVSVKLFNSLLISLVAIILVATATTTFLTLKVVELNQKSLELEREVAKQLGLAELYDQDKVAYRIAVIQEEVRQSKIRNFISKTNKKLSPVLVADIVAYKNLKSKEYNVPLDLLLTVGYQESSFRPEAKSPTGPRGWMQIAPSYWAAECGTTANGLYDVKTNINCGAYILAKHYKTTKNWDSVLKRYYGGTSQENATYAKKIRKNLNYVRSEIS